MAKKLREDERHFAAQMEEQSSNLGMQRENATHANHVVIIERGGNMQDITLQERLLDELMLALELLLLLLAVDCLSSSVGCKLCIASTRMDMLVLPLAFTKS